MAVINEINGHEVHSYHTSHTTIVHYFLYFLLIDGINEAFNVAYNLARCRGTVNEAKLFKMVKTYFAFISGSFGILLYSNKFFVGNDFLSLLIADLLFRFPKLLQLKGPPNFTYGQGLACSYVEGYLVHVIPPDGKYCGFQNNVEKYEQRHGIVFPVRKMFIVINKAMYCPPDLKQFNKENRPDLSSLEACTSLEKIVKDVAGVKNRTYSNSVYRIKRRNKKYIYVVAGTSSPLNTLYNVLRNKILCDVLSHINEAEVVEHFSLTLQEIISKSPVYKACCEIIFFDSEDPKQNLADVLLKRIMEMEENFENIRRDE